VHFDRILLTGFMGSGKSTVGRLLAARLGWQFLDLDDAIEALGGDTVPNLFARHGEPHFRTLETQALTRALTTTRTVIALGGGAPETEANRLALTTTPGTAVVLLHAPFATLFERCEQQAVNNPSATARPNLASREAAGQRYTRRQPLYAAIATHTIDCSTSTPEQTAAAILNVLEFEG
jgi:shikimate kinase